MNYPSIEKLAVFLAQTLTRDELKTDMIALNTGAKWSDTKAVAALEEKGLYLDPSSISSFELLRAAHELAETTEEASDEPTPGRKYDSGKPMMRLIPPHAALAVGEVLTYGAKKYDPENWRHVPEAHERYMDAALRHLNASMRGEDIDPESGLPHLAHAITSLLFILELDMEPTHDSE